MTTPIEWDARAFRRLMAEAQDVPAAAAAERWPVLVAAHVLGQGRFMPHLQVHLAMLRTAWHTRDAAEVCGQLWRLLLTPFGHLSGRLPWGNTGRADVSAWRAMAVPEAVRQRIAQARQR